MRLGSLVIENFRGIRHVEIPFHPKLTLLVGANNAGKTTVLDALAAILSHRRGTVPFSDLDLRSDNAQADIRKAPPIRVGITLLPSTGKNFRPGELGETLAPEVTGDGQERLRLRLVGEVAKPGDTHTLSARLVLLQEQAGQAVQGKELGSFPFRTQLPLRQFGMERDLGRGMATRFSPWTQILGEIHPSLEVLSIAMAKLREGSQALIAGTPELTALSSGLQQLARVVGVAQTELSLAPEDLEMLMRQLFIVLTQEGARRGFSGGRHGHGTQAVLLFGIYKVFTDALLRREGGAPELNPILTVEEPETHLHPVARRAMADKLSELPGQVVVTTHSPELVAEVAPEQVVLLRSCAEGCQVGFQSPPEAAAGRKLRQHAQALFAKALLVVEGEETELLPPVAQALGVDLALLGIERINAGGQDSILGLYQQFREAYGVPTVCIGDADEPDKIRHFLEAIDPSLKSPPGSACFAAPESFRETAKNHDYYCCPIGQSIEVVLAATVPDLVDRFLRDEGEAEYATWKAELQHPGHYLKRQRKKLGDLSEEEARAFRLQKFKTRYPRVLGEWLAADPARIPPHLRQAIERAAQLAGGH